VDSVKQHLKLIKREKLEKFYDLARKNFFKGNKKVLSGEIIRFFDNEMFEKDNEHPFISVLKLMDKDDFDVSHSQFISMTSFVNQSEIYLMKDKGLFDDHKFPLFVYFNAYYANGNMIEIKNVFNNNDLYSHIDELEFFDYAVEYGHYTFVAKSKVYSDEEKKQFLLENIKKFNKETDITSMLFYVVDKSPKDGFKEFLPYDLFINTLIKEDKIKLLGMDGLNSFSYNEAEMKEDEQIFFGKCYPFMSEKTKKIVQEKFPLGYIKYEKFNLSEIMNESIPNIPKKRI